MWRAQDIYDITAVQESFHNELGVDPEVGNCSRVYHFVDRVFNAYFNLS